MHLLYNEVCVLAILVLLILCALLNSCTYIVHILHCIGWIPSPSLRDNTTHDTTQQTEPRVASMHSVATMHTMTVITCMQHFNILCNLGCKLYIPTWFHLMGTIMHPLRLEHFNNWCGYKCCEILNTPHESIYTAVAVLTTRIFVREQCPFVVSISCLHVKSRCCWTWRLLNCP